MRYCLLAAVAVTAIAAPAQARDGQAYFGVEGGILFPKDVDGENTMLYTTTQSPAMASAVRQGVRMESCLTSLGSK